MVPESFQKKLVQQVCGVAFDSAWGRPASVYFFPDEWSTRQFLVRDDFSSARGSGRKRLACASATSLRIGFFATVAI